MTGGGAVSDDGTDEWSRALGLAKDLTTATVALERADPELPARLRGALRDPVQRGAALVLISVLPTEYTVELAEELAETAISQRDHLLVREIFGRLTRDQIVSVVPPAVARRLAGYPDDEEAYRRLAELLYHLGLDDALRELSAAAAQSDDSGVREVGVEFLPD